MLAAGAYGSPGILLRSDAPALRELPIGEGLIDHVGVGFGFEGTDRLQREAAEFERAWPLYMSQVTVEGPSGVCAPGVCDLFLFPALDPPGPEGYQGSAAVFAMKPWSRGTVRLTSPDLRAPLAIDHGFLTDERDVAVLVDGVEALRSLAASEEVRAYAARELRRGPTSTPSATCARPPGASFTRWARARSARWSTATAACAAATACRSPTPRSCRRSRARTRT